MPQKADKAGQLNGEGLVKALQSIKDFDSGGLSAPLTIKKQQIPCGQGLEGERREKDFGAGFRLDDA